MEITQTAERARAGDKNAFAQLYTYYHKELYRYAYYVLRHEQDAQDVVAETVACAYAEIKKLRKPELFSVWMFRILSNQIQRKKKMYAKERSKQLPLEELGDLIDPAQQMTEEKMDLYRALGQLSEENRQIVVLSVIAGFASHEVAQILQKKPATVRSRLSRSLKQLQTILSAAEVPSGRKENRYGKETNE